MRTSVLTGTNLKYTKAYNYRIVLESVRLHGPLSRADIARNTSLTAQTVSNIMRELMEAGLVKENGKRQQGRGAPATTLAINPDSAFAVGLDFDRDHLTGVLLDFSGEVRQRVHRELDFLPPEEALGLMTDIAETLVSEERAAQERVLGVGVSFPGPLDISGGSVASSFVNPKKFPGWNNVPVASTLHERLSMPIFLENNAAAAAVGERWYGDGQEIDTFFYLYFGSGLGGGIVLDGSPFDGHTGNAGELGYLPALQDERAPFSRAASPEHAGERFHLPTLYQALQEHGFDATTPGDLDEAYRTEAPPLRTWLDAAGRQLSHLAMAVEYLIDPETIFLGGRLPDAIIGELLGQLEETLPELRIAGKPTHPELAKATAGMDAAALGVATLPLYESLSPTPHLLLKRERTSKERAPSSPAPFGGGS